MPPKRSGNEITIEDLAIRFLDHCREYYRKGGKTTYSIERAQTALAPVVQFYGGNTVSEFGPLSLKFVRDKMVDAGLAREIG